MTLYRRLVLAALALTTLVVVFGAYVRLSDAGLGCPDWPGCYGRLTPHHAATDILETHAADPHGPVSLPKAWKEMIHRYLAASLGLLIIAVAVLAWRRRDDSASSPRVAAALVGLVIFQGLLGKWTVTLLLKPAIVTAHLLGGLATLGLLAWLALKAWRMPPVTVSRRLLGGARVALVLLVVQITLGGWTSTNYAALACSDFPACQGTFWPPADYADAFHVVRELGMTADGEILSFAALTAIHWSHRIGAALIALALSLLAWALFRGRATRAAGLALFAALALQTALGVANVLFSLPLPLAVAHNAGAALLLGVMVTINYRMRVMPRLAAVGRSEHERAEHENSYA
ncbi:COX15/CtaA family protein [Aromatoleum buckelii]|uniref:Heme A synthase n=1 Tax=Aromatoleum buckelii TaxID=200254 RepID=A0ABX1N2R7_9RHOO|nr:COX15/CtaA family protein [Aromatoleum buckelii]MCK0510719.1 COX15/CtaA family protein [Aromatoleum buckelii]